MQIHTFYKHQISQIQIKMKKNFQFKIYYKMYLLLFFFF